MKNFKEKLDVVFKDFDFKPNDIQLYFQAFTHPSYANEAKVSNNERLEFLGDAILEFLVTKFIYQNFPDLSEGEMSKMRMNFVCEKANSEYALDLKLNVPLLLGKGEEEHGGRNKQSVLGNVFEAFLGAIYLDLGLEYVQTILEKVTYPRILNPQDDIFTDHKSRLQEYTQSINRRGVDYVLEKEYGPSHDKTFVVSVFHDGIKLGTGIGKSKKEAEQQAAKDALSKLAVS